MIFKCMIWYSQILQYLNEVDMGLLFWYFYNITLFTFIFHNIMYSFLVISKIRIVVAIKSHYIHSYLTPSCFRFLWYPSFCFVVTKKITFFTFIHNIPMFASFMKSQILFLALYNHNVCIHALKVRIGKNGMIASD